MNDTTALDCWIYKSPRKDEMYLYLTEEDGFDAVPEALLAHFGRPRFVMRLQLTPERRLAREDTERVMAALREQGFFLQLPPRLEPHLYHGNED